LKSNSIQLLVKLLPGVLVAFIVLINPNFAIAQSKDKLDSLSELSAQAGNDSIKIIHEIELTREMHKKACNKQEEYALAKKAVERAVQLKDTLLYARALDNFGLLYRYHRTYKEATELHFKAFELIQDKNVPSVYKMIFANNAGVASRYNQNYDTAISYYMKALKIAEQQNNLKNIAISSNGIGNALGHIPTRAEEAIRYFKRSLSAEKKRGNSLGMAMNYLSISDYYINKNEFKTARKYLTNLLKINKKRQDDFGLAITYQFMGICYLKEGKQLKKATSNFKNALRRFSAMNNIHKQAEILTSLGETKQKEDQLKAAERYYQKSLVLSKKINRFNLIQENSLRLSQIMEVQNKPEQALNYYKTSEDFEDSIELGEQNIKIEALTQKYDLTKKESRIKLLEKDQALQQTILKNRNNQLAQRQIIMIFLAIAVLLLLIIFALQYRNYRIKKKTNARILKEEKEKLKAINQRNLARAETIVTRLRINPHFLFNSLNAITYLIQSEQNAKAIKYLVVFSRYTRMVLETSKNQVIPLQEELKLAKYYLTLEENRFEEDFTFIIKGDKTTRIEGVNIPPLLLQPFLENAIWHGLLPSESDNRIVQINIEPSETGLKILIDDNGIGRKSRKEKQAKKRHKSMGMDIIKERIDLFNKFYDEKINYNIVDKTDDNNKALGTQIVLELLKQNQSKVKATG